MASNNNAPDPLVFSHACIDSRPWPQPNPDGTTDLVIEGYHAAQLLARSRRIRNTPPTNAQLQLRHTFLADYVSGDPETASYDEAYDFLRTLMVDLDRYFFCGALTRTSGPDDPPLVTLQLYESPPYSYFGVTGETTYTLNAPRCVVRVWRSQRGGRRHAKHALLQTLLHELTHAYLQCFYGRCATDPAGGEELLDGPGGDGHGDLYWAVLRDAEAALRSWDRPLLARVRDPVLALHPLLRTRPLAHRAEDWYLSLVAEVPRVGAALSAEWLQVGPGGHPLRAAMLRLRYPSYLDFVRARVASWRGVMFGAVCVLVFLLVATVEVALWE